MKKLVVIIIFVAIICNIVVKSDFGYHFYEDNIKPSSVTNTLNHQSKEAYEKMCAVSKRYVENNITVEHFYENSSVILRFEDNGDVIYSMYPKIEDYRPSAPDWEAGSPLDSLALSGVTYEDFLKAFLEDFSSDFSAENVRIIPNR